jgi:hypothetical protein
MNNIDKNTKSILINFDFEEVNSAVLRNAQIWKFKQIKNNKQEFSVYVPVEFAHLYFHADNIFTFKNDQHPEYSKILDYKPSARVMLFLNIKARIYSLLLNIFRNNLFKKYVYQKHYVTPRQLNFLIQSGLQEKILKKIKEKCVFEYVRVGDYMDCSTFTVVENNLTKWFQLTFSYLAEMISNGDVYAVPQGKSALKNIKYENLTDYFLSSKPKLVLRTRNFKQKAVTHNSKVTLLKPLIVELLKEGFCILNLGTPTMPLDVNSNSYYEVSHNMSIEDEFLICGTATACIMTAEAGLFTAFAATNLSLIQYDDEWSVSCVDVSLFDARINAGLQDLDIRVEIANGKFDEAAKKITDFCKGTSLATGQVVHFSPVIVELGAL